MPIYNELVDGTGVHKSRSHGTAGPLAKRAAPGNIYA